MMSLVYLLLAGVVGASSPDWPQFRGPRADGHAEGPIPAVEWSETKNVTWRVAVPGLGWSSPVVIGDRVYLTTAVPEGEGLSLRALAIDTGSGMTVWDREVRRIEKRPKIHGKNSHASPTPIVRDGAVYVHFGPLGMARLDARDGRIVWLCEELTYAPVHGSGGSPVLIEGMLVVTCDGANEPFVAAVDAATGRVKWRSPRSVKARNSFSFATPAVTESDGKPLVVAPGSDHCAAYDAGTGEERWKVRAAGWSVVPQPVIGHGLVIYNHDYDRPELLAVRLGGTGDLTDTHVAWRLSRAAPSTPSPVLVGDDLYFVSDKGIASAVDAKTGAVHWTERIGGNHSASPILVADRILLLDEVGRATWVRAGRTFERLETNELPGRTLATPAFAGGAMYLRTDESLYKIAAP
jgi:outer membrane protein assembly factor BamB